MKLRFDFLQAAVLFVAIGLLCIACKKEDLTHDPRPALLMSDPDRALPYMFTDWMGNLPDSLSLCQITIPGTHDCAADNHSGGVPSGSHWDVVCQDFRFLNQLYLGVRFFDVRFDDVDNQLHHGGFILSRNLNDIIGDALAFLKGHPTETVVFLIKKEFGGSSDATFSEKVWTILAHYPLEKFYRDVNMPRLGDVRGKIVLATHDNNDRNGHWLGLDFKWPDNTSLHYDNSANFRYYVHDHYSLNSVSYDSKSNEVRHLIDISSQYPDGWRMDLNFTNGEKDGIWVSIKEVAHNINGNIRQYLLEHIDWRHCGVILVNYAGGSDDGLCSCDLVRLILQHNDFPTVKIALQTWMGKDLDAKHYQNGDPIPQVQDPVAWSKLTTGAYCDIGYGIHYNWYAVNDSRGLAPAGWRIATETDWDLLVMNTGGAGQAGKQLKEASSLHWWHDAGENNFLFTALPTGARDKNGNAGGFGESGNWWCATGHVTDSAILYHMNFDNDMVMKFVDSKKLGLTVRCIKK
ncbi:MAG TPA: FISUMP domain-containing protein [Bacteroidales bacterium]|nr:FISUMP domain-containing protein [Bacteroidales bacterium]HSA43758.1 FISUMP domain-containing protein [Bacteroidales bacterium]